jgi:hypothetical protein
LKAASLSLAALAVSLAVPSAAEDPPSAARPEYHEGDVFEFVGRFESITCSRWVVEARAADGSQPWRCGENVAHFLGDTGALTRIVGRGGKELVSFEPASPAMAFPMHVGATWHGKFRLSTSADLVSPDLDESCEVTAFETVVVAAGSFPAFRYECKTAWSVWPLHGTATETGWYAPAARTVVRVVNDASPEWNLELARYSFK